MKRIACFCLLGVMLGVAPAARAGTKEELIRLQADVLALQNQIRMLEKTFTERTDSLTSLVTQLNDQVGKTSLLLGKVTTTLDAQRSGDSATQQTLVQEIRTLSSKIDETGTRVSALAQQLAQLKVQSKPITQRIFQTASGDPQALALSADAIYNEAFNDLVQGNFDLAIEGFHAFLNNFPSNEKADDARYNIGEANYSAQKYEDAIAAFSAVITDYPSGDKIGSAYFKRAKSQLALGNKDDAIADFSTVVQKFPDSAEANLARAELQSLGVDPSKLRRSGRRRPH